MSLAFDNACYKLTGFYVADHDYRCWFDQHGYDKGRTKQVSPRDH